MITVTPTTFGFRHKARVQTLDDTKGELTQALIEQKQERRRWWRPWKQLRIDGYQSPWKD